MEEGEGGETLWGSRYRLIEFIIDKDIKDENDQTTTTTTKQGLSFEIMLHLIYALSKIEAINESSQSM